MTDKERKDTFKAVRKYLTLKEEPEFDTITRMAALQCGVPYSIISMLDNRNQYFKSHYGIDIQKTTLEESFCKYATQSSQELFLVEDARQSALLKDHPLLRGSEPWLFYAAISLRDESGKPFGTLAVLDHKPGTLSDLQKASLKNLAAQAQQLVHLRAKERELKISRNQMLRKTQRLNNIIYATQVGTWEWNVQSGEVRINERWAQMLGYTWQELLPHDINTWYRLVHPEDRSLSEQKVQDCFDQKVEYYNIECRLIHKNGNTVWVNDRGRVVQRTPDGKPLWMMGTHTDITRQKLEERRLRILEGAVTKANDMVLVWDAESVQEKGLNIIFINEAFTRITGYTQENIIGKSSELLYGNHTDAGEVKKLEEAISQEKPITVTLLNYKKDGALFWNNIAVNPVYDGAERLTHWISIGRDVTEQKNEQLRKLLHGAMGEVFGREESLVDALHSFLRYLIELGKMTLAEVWMINKANNAINLTAQVATTELLQKQFKDKKVPRVFQYGEGLPGVTWQKDCVQQWHNLGENPQFLRSVQAQKSSLKSGLGVPLKVSDEVIGVLLLASDQTNEEFSFHNQIYHGIGYQLGAELQRKRLEVELYQIYEAAPDIICTTDFEGRFLRLNPAASKLLEYSHQELREISLDKLIHPEDREKSRQAFEKLLKGGGVTYFENRYFTSGGAIVHLAWSATAHLEERKIYAVAKNITEKKKMELRLQASNKSLQDLKYALNITTNIVLTDKDGYILEVNDSTCELSGYRREELIGEHTRINKSGEHSKEFYRQLWTTIKAGKVWRGEIKNRRKDGSFYWVDTTIVPLTNEQGLIERFLSIRIDITEKAKLQQLLQDTNDLARIGTWEVNVDNDTIYWSPMVYAIHEVPGSYEPALGESLNFYHPDYKDQVSEQVQKCLDKGEPFDFEAVIITQKGKERWVRAVGQAEMVNGRCKRIYGIVQDIDERKSAQLRLAQTANNLPGAIFQYTLYPDGTDAIQNLTAGALHLWGETAEACMADIELIWQQAKAGGDFELLWETIALSAETMEPWHCRYRSRKPNGELMWHEGFGRPKKLSDGAIRWDSLIIDITGEKENELLLEEASALAKIGSWEVNMQQPEPRYIYCSAMTCTILEEKPGFKPEFHEGFGAFAGNGSKKLKAAMEKLIETGEEYDLEVQLITAKETKKWVRCIGQADHHNGACMRIYGSMQDINEQKLAKIALEEAFDERNQILESIGDAFFAVDNNWKVTYWNYQAEKILGVDRKEIVGADLWEKFADAKELEFYDRYNRAMQTGHEEQFEAYYPAVAKWFEVSAYPNDKGLSVYFKDVTSRREVERKIRESNERFEKVAQATNDVIYDYNILETQIFRGNRFQTDFGFSHSNKFKGLEEWKSHIHPKERTKVSESLTHSLGHTTDEKWEMEYRLTRADGSYATVIDRGVIIRNDEGMAVRMVGAMTDITDRKAYEEKLKELNKKLRSRARALAISNAELEQFAYVASHDLQEPLRMVSSFLTQLEKKYGEVLDEKAHRYIHFAVDGAQRMRQIILDLLEFSRVGKQEELLEKVPVSMVLEEVQRLLHREIDQSGARISYANMPVLQTYKTALLQIFQNLISNAIRYGKEGQSPEVKISAKKRKDDWIFAVSDNGIGIDEEYFDKIFVIFQRLHRQDQYSGTGMGLPIVKKHCENMGGKVWLKSKVGEGSTFYFTLPEKPS